MTANPSDLERLALLVEPTRRAIYQELLRRGELGRDAAARAVGIGRSLAAFHLDRLAEAGLLEVEYRRLSGRTGPGAGRPAKVYRVAPTDLAVSVPPRDYELAARILVDAVRAAGPQPAALRRAARQQGVAIGRQARRRAGVRPGRDRLVRSLTSTLRERGFEPITEGGEIRLRNCPFDALATEQRDTICGMNLALLEGVLDGLGATGLRAVLEQRPGMCCVSFRRGDRA